MNVETKIQPDSKPRDRVVSRQETASILNVSTRTLRRMELRGELPRVQITERCFGHRLSHIEQLIAARTGRVAA